MRKPALLVLLLAGVSGFAHAGLFSDDEARQGVQALQERVTKLEAQLNGKGMVDLLNQLESIKAQLAQMQGQIEVLNHEIEVTQKRQKDLYVDTDTRLQALEKPAQPAPAPDPAADAKSKRGKGGKKGAEAAPAAQPEPKLPVVPVDADNETRAYDAAFRQFKAGNYQDAIAAFQAFLESYPKSGQAAAAQYWIGNSYFSLRDYKNAVDAQQKVVSQYPSSGKVPDAMLNIASSQQGLGDEAAACATLAGLVSKYPVSNAAELAKKRMGGCKAQ